MICDKIAADPSVIRIKFLAVFIQQLDIPMITIMKQIGQTTRQKDTLITVHKDFNLFYNSKIAQISIIIIRKSI